MIGMMESSQILCEEIWEHVGMDWWLGGEPQEASVPELPGPVGHYEDDGGPIPMNLATNLWQEGNGGKGIHNRGRLSRRRRECSLKSTCLELPWNNRGGFPIPLGRKEVPQGKRSWSMVSCSSDS